MKTYQSPGSFAFAIRTVILPLLIIIIYIPGYSQELAIVKSSFQSATTSTSWTDAIRNSEGSATHWMTLLRSNNNVQTVQTEKQMEVIESSFSVSLDNRRSVINWSSIQDINTSFYIIERSANGQPFKEIAQIFTSPDSAAKFDYQYFDKLTNDIKGSIYYRLKIIDANNKAIYSPVQLASSNKSYENLLVSLKN